MRFALTVSLFFLLSSLLSAQTIVNDVTLADEYTGRKEDGTLGKVITFGGVVEVLYDDSSLGGTFSLGGGPIAGIRRASLGDTITPDMQFSFGPVDDKIEVGETGYLAYRVAPFRDPNEGLVLGEHVVGWMQLTRTSDDLLLLGSAANYGDPVAGVLPDPIVVGQVPEPSSHFLILAASLGLLFQRHRHRTRSAKTGYRILDAKAW